MPPKHRKTGPYLNDAERRFALWALRSLDLSVAEEEEGQYRLVLPAAVRGDFGHAETLVFSFSVNGSPHAPGTVAAGVQPSGSSASGGADSPAGAVDVESQATNGQATNRVADVRASESELWTWLLRQMRSSDQVWHAAPESQPQRIHEISAKLFSAYHVSGGNMHLGGCTLEERPILRLSYFGSDGSPGGLAHLLHAYVTAEGERVSDEQVQALGLDRVVAHVAPSRLDPQQLRLWKRTAVALCRPLRREEDLVAVTVIWCKHAEGKIAIEIGAARREIPFSTWARPLVTGSSSPPPFRCPRTGRSSYRIAADDEGYVTVEEALASCEVSGKRVVADELDRCAATGKLVRRDLLADCPVTGQRVLHEALQPCTMCQQHVHPAALRDHRCTACRSLRPVSKDDPRLARILGEHPKLDQWGRWRMAETARVYIVTAAAMFRRWLWVIDKETLHLLRVGEGMRFSRRWADAPPADYPE